LTLDPAAAYANLLYQRDDVEYAVAHPCHPSVFLQRKTEAELNDTFGGIAAAQDVVAALQSGNQKKITIAEEVIRLMYAPVLDVHWVTVKQLAYLEPILVEVVACKPEVACKFMLGRRSICRAELEQRASGGGFAPASPRRQPAAPSKRWWNQRRTSCPASRATSLAVQAGGQ